MKMTLKRVITILGLSEIDVEYLLGSKGVVIVSATLNLDLSAEDRRELADAIRDQLKKERDCRFADEDKFFEGHLERETSA